MGHSDSDLGGENNSKMTRGELQSMWESPGKTPVPRYFGGPPQAWMEVDKDRDKSSKGDQKR